MNSSIARLIRFVSMAVVLFLVGCGNNSTNSNQSVSRKPDNPGQPVSLQPEPVVPPVIAKSWNPAVTWDAEVVTVDQITHGKFKRLDGKGDDKCCSPDAWKRALPGQWANHKEYFVQINNVKVRSDAGHLPDGPGAADSCNVKGSTYGDAHIPVQSTDDPNDVDELVVEFDRCWWSENLCDERSVLPKAGDLIDVQGFVTWDNGVDDTDTCPAGPGMCWEIHPVAAWRLSSEAPKPGYCGHGPSS